MKSIDMAEKRTVSVDTGLKTRPISGYNLGMEDNG